MQVRQIGFMNPKSKKNYYGFWDKSILVGFVNILEEKEEVFIGIGVNPDLCNKHYGQRMLLITYEISKKLYPDKPLYLEVRTWNIRRHTRFKCDWSSDVCSSDLQQELVLEHSIE